MKSSGRFAKMIVCGVVPMACLTASIAWACGGFFCQLIPINQAGEQIIFRQDGNQVTVIVQIQYSGDAEDFSWVLPVPGVPEFEIASDLIFSPLELATRPQFVLDVEGDPCDLPDIDFANSPSADLGGGGADEVADDGVDILVETVVGPFALQLVTSEDPAAMAVWLEENDYDIGDRGQELIGPYVEEGMNFVALRLLQNQSVGDIEPLKLVYESETPMIPIRLTAVAAIDDMGVLVWMLGDSRAVPLNYPAVEVNYTKLNWYNGPFAAFADYQNLVTEAMNETGEGQGFATDYAGRDIDMVSQLPNPDTYRSELVRMGAVEDTGDFYFELVNNFLFPQDKVLGILRRQLPLAEGQDEVAYQIPDLLEEAVGIETMEAARTPILNELIDGIIAPLETSLAVFDGMPYMTRLFTTLSADEMTVDPIFSYNPDLDDQPLTRRATLRFTCDKVGQDWEVELGEGTGREGEVVIRGTGFAPGFGGAQPQVDQAAIASSRRMSRTGQGVPVESNRFSVVQVENTGGVAGGDVGGGSAGGGLTRFCGFGILLPLCGGLMVLVAGLLRRR